MQQEAADQKQVDMMASSSSSYEQIVYDLLGYMLCIKHIDYSVGFAGGSGAPNAVLKAFPAPEKKRIIALNSTI